MALGEEVGAANTGLVNQREEKNKPAYHHTQKKKARTRHRDNQRRKKSRSRKIDCRLAKEKSIVTRQAVPKCEPN